MINASNTNIELLNADGLDSILYNGDGGSYVSPEMIQASATTTAAIVSSISNRQKSELKSVCGRKPLLFKKKKQAYQKCVDNYLKTKSEASKPAPTPPPPPSYTPPPSSRVADSGKKFLGMPMGVGITVAVLATAAIGFGVYKLVLKK